MKPPRPPRRRHLLQALPLSAALAFGLGLGLAGPTTAARAADKPYDESADAEAALRQALADAKARQRPLLVIFGANWCTDCRALDQALKTGANAELMQREFTVLKIDVGNFDRNLALVQAYGNPIRKGIPAAVLLNARNELLYATQGGELADARHMSETGLHDFFQQVLRQSRAH